MAKQLSLADDQSSQPDPVAVLADEDIEAVVITREADLDSIRSEALPHLALVDATTMAVADLRHFVRACARTKLPVIALVPERRVSDLDPALGIDDFVVSPINPDELVTRAKMVIRRTASPEDSSVIRMGELVINPTSYEVSLRGRRINLRFKEYELLRLLATNPGRVFTREVLLSRIWGYDYFGGTRTVDVHIRRLRSKIEVPDHSFIETIWNVGYRFRAQTLEG